MNRNPSKLIEALGLLFILSSVTWSYAGWEQAEPKVRRLDGKILKQEIMAATQMQIAAALHDGDAYRQALNNYKSLEELSDNAASIESSANASILKNGKFVLGLLGAVIILLSKVIDWAYLKS